MLPSLLNMVRHSLWPHKWPRYLPWRRSWYLNATDISRPFESMLRRNPMFIVKRWSNSLTMSLELKCPCPQSAVRLKKRRYRVKRYVFISSLMRLIIATKDCQGTQCIPTTWMVSSTRWLDLWSTHLHRWIRLQWTYVGSEVWMGTSG